MLVCPLGPLLFSMYIWMTYHLLLGAANWIMYCDDMELHYSIGDLLLAQRGLQSDLDSADLRLRTNQLSLNVRSHVMLIGSWQKLQGSDICELQLMEDNFLEYHLLNILGYILMGIWLGRGILNMFIKGCSQDCTIPYQICCLADCIVLLSLSLEAGLLQCCVVTFICEVFWKI